MVLQMWFNKDISKDIKKYMLSVKKHTKDPYYFIGYPQNAPVGSIVLEPTIEINKALDYLGNKDWWNKYCTHAMFVSEMVRLAWALQSPDLIYADADIELFAPLVVKDINKPHFMKIPNGYDFSFFYSGNIEWWKQFMDLSINRNGDKAFSFVHTLREIYLFNLMEKPLIIPNNIYKHYYYHKLQ